MITLEQAKKLCVLAHQDQFRRAVKATYEEVIDLIGGSKACDLEAGVLPDRYLDEKKRLYSRSEGRQPLLHS